MISREEPLWCADDQRSAVLAAPAHPLNGIDFVEYRRNLLAPLAQRHRVEVTFLKPPPAALLATPAAFRIEGGVRVVGIAATGVAATPDPLRIVVFVDREGDFSVYWLRVDHPDIDSERAESAFSFKASCPTEFDCRPRHDCDDPVPAEPALDYLAKDYQSFRRLLMDLGPQLNPDFTERNPADLAVTLVELFAYVGDYLSYHQDWAATEAFFETCRDRISAARHARLVDYAMHQGRNAHGFVQFDGAPAVDGTIVAGTKLTTRIANPLRGQPAPPPLVIAAGQADFDSDPALDGVTVFETTASVRVMAARNLMRIHDWGDAACCLARGAREAWLYTVRPLAGDLMANRPHFDVGEYLLLEEVLGPATGLAADADPRQRQVVRLEMVDTTATDQAFRNRLVGGVLTPAALGDTRLPLTHVRWRDVDATTRAFCLSSVDRISGAAIPGVTVARGNVTPADHGLSRVRTFPNALFPDLALPPPNIGTGRWPIDIQPLGETPLTFLTMADDAVLADDGRLAAGRHDLDRPASAAMPAIAVEYVWDGGETELFRPVRSLINSSTYDPHFVVETSDGGAQLRFGDDQYGRRLGEPVSARARYRIGNGRSGNIGHGALVHAIIPDALDLVDPSNPGGGALPFPAIIALRQPLPASGGTDPETIEQARQIAPAAFRAETYRAVTEADYAAVALRLSGVAAAKARFRWTGSWYTVFVALHPYDLAALVRLPGGGAALTPAFAARARAWLDRHRLAGYDLVVRAAIYVPLELEIRICIAPGHFRGQVLATVAATLAARPGGLFDPAAFNFGEPLYLSQVYARLQAVDGVESALIIKFQRYWDVANGELERGLIAVAPDEIVRLDNDPSQPENGVLRLNAMGGL